MERFIKTFGNKYQIGGIRYTPPSGSVFWPAQPPVVQSVKDDREYIDTAKITPEQKGKLFDRMWESNPDLFNHLMEDPFIAMLRDNFNASLLIEKRKR